MQDYLTRPKPQHFFINRAGDIYLHNLSHPQKGDNCNATKRSVNNKANIKNSRESKFDPCGTPGFVIYLREARISCVH